MYVTGMHVLPQPMIHQHDPNLREPHGRISLCQYVFIPFCLPSTTPLPRRASPPCPRFSSAPFSLPPFHQRHLYKCSSSHLASRDRHH
ncbi:hypothetical protein E2C01_048299 [Portunus trituberculatus]|uniref:Uncharacterized protein n=1 Tax=Portunus trituberculatus TaxID=210409 RepID=A0A5B7GB71_PORTR|nr:hypothetical protein [Portunus trituberculatus]